MASLQTDDRAHHRRRFSGRDPDEEHRVATPLELLYDLTIVVAFGTAADQLAHYIADDHAGPGVLGFTLASFAVTWAWLAHVHRRVELPLLVVVALRDPTAAGVAADTSVVVVPLGAAEVADQCVVRFDVGVAVKPTQSGEGIADPPRALGTRQGVR